MTRPAARTRTTPPRAKEPGRPRIDLVAEGTPPNVTEFAYNLFGGGEKIPARQHGALRLSLQEVIARLHDSEINVGLQSFALCGLQVWIGDPLSGKAAEGSIETEDPGWLNEGSVALWLHETALRLYPESQYARQWGDTLTHGPAT